MWGELGIIEKGLTLLMVTRLAFGSKLWRLFSSTMPHPTWFYNTQLGIIHETQAFVQVVMLVWSWSWFVMIFYLLSYLGIYIYWWRNSMIYVGVGDVAAVDDCWCRWQLRRSRVPGHQDVILMFTFSFYSKKSESEMLKYFFYSFGHQDVISMFTLSFYSKKSESEMLKILLLTALAPGHQDVLPSLTFAFGAVCSCSVCSF